MKIYRDSIIFLSCDFYCTLVILCPSFVVKYITFSFSLNAKMQIRQYNWHWWQILIVTTFAEDTFSVQEQTSLRLLKKTLSANNSYMVGLLFRVNLKYRLVHCLTSLHYYPMTTLHSVEADWKRPCPHISRKQYERVNLIYRLVQRLTWLHYYPMTTFHSVEADWKRRCLHISR